jgi:hypothetical protein
VSPGCRGRRSSRRRARTSSRVGVAVFLVDRPVSRVVLNRGQVLRDLAARRGPGPGFPDAGQLAARQRDRCAGAVRTDGGRVVVEGVLLPDDDDGRSRACSGPVGGAGAFDGTPRWRQRRCRAQYQFHAPSRLQNLRVATEPPQRGGIGISGPREGQRAADQSKQHPDEEPAKVRRDPGTKRQHYRKQ